jgi:hypothetical protein
MEIPKQNKKTMWDHAISRILNLFSSPNVDFSILLMKAQNSNDCTE